jgi:AbrB family looped-hinge helix DNA binding protein
MSKVTSKGQVTIPKEMRDRLGLLPGTEVEFVPETGAVSIRKLRGGRRRGEKVVEHLRESGKDFTMTTDEIMRLTRGENWSQGT